MQFIINHSLFLFILTMQYSGNFQTYCSLIKHREIILYIANFQAINETCIIFSRVYTHNYAVNHLGFKLTFWDAESLLVLLETFETLQERL